MDEVRIGIIGMGIGRANAGGFIRTPRARVTALCDVLEARMVETAVALNLPDAKHYTSYEAMCRDPEIDAVVVGVGIADVGTTVAIAVLRSAVSNLRAIESGVAIAIERSILSDLA